MEQIKKRVVYIAHPISGNVKANLERIRQIVRIINLSSPHIVPFAPYWLDCHALDDNNAEERARGIENDMEYFKRAVMDELWVFGYNKVGEHSKGVQAEIEMATSLGIPIVYAESSVAQWIKQDEPDQEPYTSDDPEEFKEQTYQDRIGSAAKKLAEVSYDHLRRNMPGEKKFKDLDSSIQQPITAEEIARAGVMVWGQCCTFELGYAEGFKDGMGDKPVSMNPYDDGWNGERAGIKYGLHPVKFTDPTTMNL